MWQFEDTNGVMIAGPSWREYSEPVSIAGRLSFLLKPEIRLLRVGAGDVVHEIPAPPVPHRFFHYRRARQAVGADPVDLFDAYGLLLFGPPMLTLTVRLYPTGGTEFVVEPLGEDARAS